LADLKVYSKEEIDEIEDLYQDAKSNRKTRKGQKSLKQLMKKYKRANRTGCAILILAGVLQGRKKEKYLLEAANEYHDCYFGNGVQIGPSALYQLLAYYRKSGDKKKAEEIRKEMNEKYPDSFDDNGYLIVPKGK
jgi:hypothetical protein